MTILSIKKNGNIFLPNKYHFFNISGEFGENLFYTKTSTGLKHFSFLRWPAAILRSHEKKSLFLRQCHITSRKHVLLIALYRVHKM